MKKYLFILLALVGLASCQQQQAPVSKYLYVVNSSDYTAEICFDNNVLAYVPSKSNAQDIDLSYYYGAPVHVKVSLLSGSKTVNGYSWDKVFDKTKTHKMVITNSVSTTKIQSY